MREYERDELLGRLDREKLQKGIADYMHEQRCLLRLIRKHERLNELEFDSVFKNREFEKPKIRFMFSKPETLLLGGISQGEWSKWLHLLQIMMALGFVESEHAIIESECSGIGERIGIAYSLTEKGKLMSRRGKWNRRSARKNKQ